MYNVRLTLTGQPIITGQGRSPVTGRMIERPWQLRLPEGKICPFCPPSKGGKLDKLEANGEIIEWHPSKDAYKMISLNQAGFTPYPAHELLVPVGHTTELFENLEQLSGALRLVFRIQRERFFSKPEITNALFGFHYGQCAAQNERHPHMQIIGTDAKQSSDCPFCPPPAVNDPLMLFETDNLVAVLDGVRAGQTVITSKKHDWDYEAGHEEIAAVLLAVVDLFAGRFKQPEFMVGSLINGKNRHFWAEYTPILNHIGFTEFLAMRGLNPYTQPCTPEAMHTFLMTGQR